MKGPGQDTSMEAAVKGKGWRQAFCLTESFEAESYLEHSCNCCRGAHAIGVPHGDLIAPQLIQPGSHIRCRCWSNLTLQATSLHLNISSV